MKQEDKKFWQVWGAVVAVGGLLLTLFTGNQPLPYLRLSLDWLFRLMS